MKDNQTDVEAHVSPNFSTSVSDSACHVTGQAAEVLRVEIPNMFRMFRGTPTFRDDGIFDISEDVDVGEDGKLRPKSE